MAENMMPTTVASGMNAMSIMHDGAIMDRMMKFAEVMATGRSTIPKELQNVGDCLAITMQAMAWGMMPQSVAQKCFFLNGRIGYEAQLVSAAINNSNETTGNFHYEWFGPWEKIIGKFDIKRNEKGQEYRVPGWKLADEEGIGIRVWATLRGESEPRYLELLLAQARTRNSTQWADDPKQQLAYLAQKKWARLYAPGVILGVYTNDELASPSEIEINPMPDSGIDNKKPPEANPPYPEDKFAENLPAWRKAIAEGGEKGPAIASQIIGRASTKFTLSDAQKAEISAPIPQQQEEQPAGNVIDADFVRQMEGQQ